MRALLRVLPIALTLAGSLAAADNTVTPAEAEDGWILLFDGQSSFGWNPEGSGKWKVANGILSFDGSGPGILRTLAVFSDYDLKLDFRGSSNADAAVILRYFTDGTPQETGYELRLGDSDAKNPAGSVVKVFSGPGKFAANQWHALEAEFNGDKISVKIDGRSAGEGSDGRSKAGYIGLAAARGTSLDFRNIKLKPIAARGLFNGSDLSGWKSVGTQPPKPSGLVKKLSKVFKPGEGKPKEADWSVVGGAIHGTKGPGQLESKDAYDDFVLQLDVRVNSKSKNHHPKSGIFLRGDAGKIETGYEVAIENDVSTGEIAGLKKPRSVLGTDNEFFTETIAVRGRHFEIWINGYPVNDYTDTRTEGPSIKKEARVAAGPVALFAPDSESNLDFKNIKISPLPKALGGKAKPPAPAPPPKIPTAPAAATPPPPMPSAPPAAPPPAPVIIANPNQAKDDARQAQVSKLTQQALKSNDPQEQAKVYSDILALDPNNFVAAQGYRDAQQKIETARAQQQKESEEKARESQDEQQKAQTLAEALKAGETAFLAGHLAAAQAQVAIGKKVAPNDAGLLNLDSRVSAAVQARQRIQMLAIGGGILVLLGAVALLFLATGKKEPYLEVVEGLEKGKRFPLDQEVVHIGAIAQDGEMKNEIVVRDTERMISRFHCEIHRRDSKLFLVDANSANGTFLEGHRIPPERPVRLKKGSHVVLGGSCTLGVGYEKKKKK